MNGWADADPAWWLNLQERPETTVELPDGPRAVRARAAAGPERERLWAGFREYPGWGADLDALAARRDRPTAVVVLEPQAAARVDRRAPQATEEGGAAAATLAAASDRSRGPKPRHLWLVPGLAIAIWANAVAGEHGLGLVPLLAFGIAPHLPALAGVGRPHARGQLVAPAVPLFNALHHPVAPLALLAVAAAGLLSPFWLVGAMAWLSHIVVDWALGDGMRTADGFVRRLAPATAENPVR
jgi:hypothetical protein